MLCYTEGGKITGGTGMAITIADSYLIPVFNLGMGLDYTLNEFEEWFTKHGLDKCQ